MFRFRRADGIYRWVETKATRFNTNGDEQIVLSAQSGFVGNVVIEGPSPGGRVTGGVYMQDNLCNGSTGGAACATTP